MATAPGAVVRCPEESGVDIDALLELMERLRDPKGGCPWDRQQTFATVAPYTVEEAYEVADAIERADYGELREELGDLLFQVVFHAQMAREAKLFAFGDVVAAIVDKMTRRHPHVFGSERIDDAAAQTTAWEARKAEERKAKAESGEHGVLDGVARTLPALVRAGKLQRRAARVGFDWPDTAGVAHKVAEELQELRAAIGAGNRQEIEEEVGDLLFACINLARHAGVDAEIALRGANAKFERRFRAVEAALRAEGRTPHDADLEEMDAHWDAAKGRE